jgi:hypothetical protein
VEMTPEEIVLIIFGPILGLVCIFLFKPWQGKRRLKKSRIEWEEESEKRRAQLSWEAEYEYVMTRLTEIRDSQDYDLVYKTIAKSHIAMITEDRSSDLVVLFDAIKFIESVKKKEKKIIDNVIYRRVARDIDV